MSIPESEFTFTLVEYLIEDPPPLVILADQGIGMRSKDIYFIDEDGEEYPGHILGDLWVFDNPEDFFKVGNVVRWAYK